MTTSSTSAPSRPLSRSEWVSTLPPWRRLLAMVNWRPVYDIEQETEKLRIESLESEKRILESKRQMHESEKQILESEKQILESEKRLKQLKNETEQLKKENKRLAALESRMDALLLNADSSSQTPPATGSN